MIRQIRKYMIVIVLFGTLAVSCSKSGATIEQENQNIESPGHANKFAKLINIRNVPVDAVFYNECCNEAVQVFGIAHFVVSDNIIHLKVSDMTGFGLSTNSIYVGKGPSVETNVFYSNQFEGTLTFMLSMSNDQGCSFRLKGTLHTTMNANGDITASIEKIMTDCY